MSAVTPEPGDRIRRCVVCHAPYPGSERFCPIDGGAIVAGEPSSSLDDPHLGKTIDGRYLVRRFIGRGGMGSVYEADHIGLDKRVAIKFLLGAATDRDALARFRREARAASKVVHEHVVQIFDVGAVDGVAFIVMEYVEGRDLRQALNDGPLDPAIAVSIARQILDGLGAIHQAGILHRDIKPANVLLTTHDGDAAFVKIMDFGISKELHGASATLTDTGKVIGTPQYMSPEQLSGAAVDQRSDLYAVGLTLYEMLAGTPTFDGTSSSVLAAMHLSQAPPSLDEVRPGLPAPVVAAVERALAKAPGDRFADARAFADALPTDVPVTSPTPAAARRDSRDLDTVRASRPRDPEPAKTDASATAQTRARSGLRWAGPVLAVAIVGGIALALVIRQREHAPETTPPAPAPVPAIDAAVAPVTPSADQHLSYARNAESEGKLELAIAEYSAAYAVAPGADTLFRIAGLHERLGNRADAARYLQRYLEAAPSASDREVVTTRIAALTAAPLDAGVDAVVRPAIAPKPGSTTTTTRPAGNYCRCVPINGEPDRMSMCKAKQTPKCKCLVETKGVMLCAVPFVKCSGASCANSWRDGMVCDDPAYGRYALAGSAGAPCRGYASPTSGAVDGVLDCNYCVGEEPYAFRGQEGGRCDGFHVTDGVRIAGVLADCDPSPRR
ncbi:MAG: protein kinase [Myxococcales bacterium]|nr:protein kinase [Myxococcales bacterium]